MTAIDSNTIDPSDSAQMDRLSRKLNATSQQLREAIDSVGDKVSDIELHLKGTRSTTNAEEVQRKDV